MTNGWRAGRRAFALLAAMAGLLLVQPVHAQTPTLAGPTLAKQPIATREYSNGYFQMSEALVNMLLARAVNETTQINEMLLGSSTRGVTKTEGQLTIDFAPNSSQALIHFSLAGQNRGDAMVAEQGPATIYSASRTQITARKAILVDAEGLHGLPAAANASTSISIQDIETRRRIVERLAWRRADRTLPEVEAAAARRVEERVTVQLDGEAEKPLAKANSMFRQYVLVPLQKQKAFPKVWRFSTTADHLVFEILQCAQKQSGAKTTPPALNQRYDVHATVHESIVGNFTELLLGGKEVQDKHLVIALELLVGEVPRPLWIHDRTDPWSLTLTKQEPIAVKFNNGQITFFFRSQGGKRGERTWSHPFEATATYGMSITSEGPYLVRVGDVAVRDLDPQAEFAERDETVQFLRNKFTGVYPPEIDFEGMTPPNGNTWGKLRELQPVEFDAQSGWFTIGYQLPRSELVGARPRTDGVRRP